LEAANKIENAKKDAELARMEQEAKTKHNLAM